MTRQLVVCSLEAWDGVWRRNQHLVAGLLRTDPGLRVLFVEPSTDPLHDLFGRRVPSRARGLRPTGGELAGRLWTYQQVKPVPRIVGTGVDALLSWGVRRAAARLGFHEPVLWINDPLRAPLVTRTRWPALYDITDDWLLADRAPRIRRRLAANEHSLMHVCAAVVVCSPQLQRDKGAQREVALVPNAVDLAQYRRPHPRPADLPDGKNVVYVGTLHEDRLDVDLCVRTAQALRGTATLTFVGPNALSQTNAARLLAEANVVVLGPKLYTDIPAYLVHANVLVVPHRVSEFTASLDPIKAYEYLAAGRAIVSTSVAGFRELAGPIVLADRDEFAASVRDAVERNTSSAIRDTPGDIASRVSDWAERVAQMREVLETVWFDQARTAGEST